jgi:multicomponent Na+:H+ antiporter subunit B
LLVVTAVAAIRLRDLFAVVMLFGIYSLVSASLFVVLDAVDVAFTEASVGAGVATVFMLGTLALTTSREKTPGAYKPLLPLLAVTITGLALVYGTWDIPAYGDPANPIHHHLVQRFIEDSPEEIGIPNIVTSVLASYRGYDTLGETTVVFTAAIGVLVLIGGARRRHSDQDESK